jgi:hypothetical protein
MTTLKVSTSKVYRRRRAIVLGVVLLIGLLIVNKPTSLFVAQDYEGTAKVMANFVVAEYEREKAINPDGVDIQKICRMAERLDDTKGLDVAYSKIENKVRVYMSLDGAKTFNYESVSIE